MTIGASLFFGRRAILASIQAGHFSVVKGSSFFCTHTRVVKLPLVSILGSSWQTLLCQTLPTITWCTSFSTIFCPESSSRLISPVSQAVIDLPHARPNTLGSASLLMLVIIDL
ncbi:hypothetical protein TREMEDRAFT_59928 [Tremella mesenterica DSM 1558]|uniref:uncharacterized protein n=1 Tax=Tremella mesenterica (strain ATCC 24925 / CBS 8224 / DSM 1558 / NBRC 9311 / NRRL Y-6157 / RJB 2259-6 / UBC 559-6) TaxID=578456 RepID=UPI0003F4A113|nr:uncharacterized protein TREMEDRAFT_59928 [Tremella mesenterica DSM 1558]EIW70989.1 hypothetical protein TREMEDRAFT_59928 [Tremella mesenterica DSM 1558]